MNKAIKTLKTVSIVLAGMIAGILLVLAVQANNRRDVLMFAWTHSEVIRQIEKDMSIEVTAKK